MFGEAGSRPLKRRRPEDAEFHMSEEPVLFVPSLDLLDKHQEMLRYSDRQLDAVLGPGSPFADFEPTTPEEALMENTFENVGVDFVDLEQEGSSGSSNDSPPSGKPGTALDAGVDAWMEMANVENENDGNNGTKDRKMEIDADNDDDQGLSFGIDFQDQIPGTSSATTVEITWNTRVRGANGELLTTWRSTEWQSTDWAEHVVAKKLPPVPEPHVLYAEVKRGVQKLFSKEIDPYHELTDDDCARIKNSGNKSALKKIDALVKDWETSNDPEVSTKIWLRIFTVAVVTWNRRVRDENGNLRREWISIEWQCEEWRVLIEEWTNTHGAVPPVPPPTILYQKASTGAARKFDNEIDLYAELKADHCATVRLGMKSQDRYSELLAAYQNAKKDLDAKAKEFWQYVHSRVVNKTQSQTTRKNQRDGLDNHFRAVIENHTALENFLNNYSGALNLAPGQRKQFEKEKKELLGRTKILYFYEFDPAVNSASSNSGSLNNCSVAMDVDTGASPAKRPCRQEAAFNEDAIEALEDLPDQYLKFITSSDSALEKIVFPDDQEPFAEFSVEEASMNKQLIPTFRRVSTKSKNPIHNGTPVSTVSSLQNASGIVAPQVEVRDNEMTTENAGEPDNAFQRDVPAQPVAIRSRFPGEENPRVRDENGMLRCSWTSTTWRNHQWAEYARKLPPAPNPNILFDKPSQRMFFLQRTRPALRIGRCTLRAISKADKKNQKKLTGLVEKWSTTQTDQNAKEAGFSYFREMEPESARRKGNLRRQWLSTEWRSNECAELFAKWRKRYNSLPPLLNPDQFFEKAGSGAARKFENEFDFYAEMTDAHAQTLRLGTQRTKEYDRLLRAYSNAVAALKRVGGEAEPIERGAQKEAIAFWQFIHARLVNNAQSDNSRKTKADQFLEICKGVVEINEKVKNLRKPIPTSPKSMQEFDIAKADLFTMTQKISALANKKLQLTNAEDVKSED
ncbi:unnamed protein product, partial [Mesorhabditis spiculigera]